METKYLNEWKDELNVCIRCAYCAEACPVFKTLGWESDTPRGKGIISYGLIEGEIEATQEIANKLLQCTSCRDCYERCSANVPMFDIILAARADMVEAGFAYDTHKNMLKNVEETGNIYGDPDLQTPTEDGEITVFLGCQYNGMGNVTKKYLNILRRLGIKPRIKKEICCGFPLRSLGFRTKLEEHKKKFLEMFPEKEMIALCPSCTAFLREEYGKDVKQVIEVIAEKMPEGADLGITATYHDPCDMSRGLDIIEEPREILEKIGVKIVEMPRSKKQSACCGGGGGMLMSDTDLSGKMAVSRMREAIGTGADMVITSCSTCEKTLKDASNTIGKNGEKKIPVKNIRDLIWQALKKLEE